MSRRQPGRTFVRALFCFMPAVLGLAFLSGCDEVYDETTLYPPRTDWLVEAMPKALPTRINPPGVLPLQSLSVATNFFGPDQDLLRNEMKAEQKIHNPLDLSDKVRSAVALVMRDLSGRPRFPKIDINHLTYEQLNKDLVRDLKLDRKTLAEGSRLYRKQCLHCHGVAGDGKGPTGLWVNPHPRDYRQGLFKFTSTGGDDGSRKPRREDLRRVLMNGVEGTSMPSFHLMKPEEIDVLVSYVIHLSIRGQAEFLTLVELCKTKKELDGKKSDLRAAEGKGDTNRVKTLEEEIAPLEELMNGPQADRVREFAALVAQQWVDSQKAESVPTPELAKKFEEMNDQQRIESAARGYRIFTVKELGGCVECHINLGRDSTYRYDAWATIVKPRNMLSNNLRGGRRPIDLYWRIHTGINGAGMPALIATEADRTKTLKDDIKPTDDEVLKKIKSSAKEEWIWDLVNFIQTVPYPDKRALMDAELKKTGGGIDAEFVAPAPAPKAEH